MRGLGILHNVHTGRFHAAVFELRPLPGRGGKGTPTRWVSRGHHTEGASDLTGAMQQIQKLQEHYKLTDNDVLVTPISWDGESTGITIFGREGDPFGKAQ